MENNLIVVEQLPIIKERLEELKGEIQEKVNKANSLVCTEDTVKDVRKVRAELGKQFKELEEQRKAVKNAVLNPYNEFETIYKENVSSLFKEADITLKTKIDSVENELKENKRQALNEYFEEYKNSLHIGFVGLDNANINITLNASKKSLMEQAKAFLDKINDDLMLIQTQEHKEEILVEYRDSLNVSQAITKVSDRFKALEEMKTRQEELAKVKEQEAKTVEKVEEVLETPKVEEPLYTLNFKVTATKPKLKELKSFLENGGYIYE